MGGSAALVHRMAEKLGDRIHLSSTPHISTWTGNSVVVTTADLEVSARTAIIAMRPVEADRIEFATSTSPRPYTSPASSWGVVIMNFVVILDVSAACYPKVITISPLASRLGLIFFVRWR